MHIPAAKEAMDNLAETARLSIYMHLEARIVRLDGAQRVVDDLPALWLLG